METLSVEHGLLIRELLKIRKDHRHIGSRKIYEMLQSFFLEHCIKIGRDSLFELLSNEGLLVKRYRRRISTTNSFHIYRKFPNLIKGMVPCGPNQLWVNDITDSRINKGFLYISFITDASSRKFVGYNVAENLLSLETVKALKKWLSNPPNKRNIYTITRIGDYNIVAINM